MNLPNTAVFDLEQTSMKQFNPWVRQIDRDVILEPEDEWIWTPGSTTDHHGVALLLYRLQGRTLDDTWVAIRIYERINTYQKHRVRSCQHL